MSLVIKVIALFIFFVIAVGFFAVRVVYLSVDEATPVFASLDDALNNGRVVGTLQQGDKVIVTKCHDVKHYIVPEVKYTSVDHGFINTSYSLAVEPVYRSFSFEITFSCP
jgi:hypothetical protein